MNLSQDVIRAKRGDFEPPISEDWFYRAQAVLRVVRPGPQAPAGRKREGS